MDKEEIIQALVDAEAEGYYGEAFKILYPGQDFEQVKKMLYFKELVKNNPDVKYDFDSWTETRPINSSAGGLALSYDVFFEKTEEYALFREAIRRLKEKNRQRALREEDEEARRQEEEAREKASKRSKWLKDPKLDGDIL